MEQSTCETHGCRQSFQTFPLSLADAGESVRIVCVRGGCNMQKRMLSMGLALDDVITVVGRQGQGALLVSKNGSRYAFGGGMAHKINVIRA